MNKNFEEKSLENLQDMALQVYGRYDIEKSLLWFVEEVGELVAAIRKGKDISDIEGELGDVFAWVLCLSNILNLRASDALKGTMKKEVSRQIKNYGHLKYCENSEYMKELEKCL